MTRVFLSGVYEDRLAMRRLAEALRRAGHEPRMDLDWSGADETNLDEERIDRLRTERSRFDDLVIADGWWKALELSDALIMVYSAAAKHSTVQSDYIVHTFWFAATARKAAFVACVDDAALPVDLSGAHVFELQPECWDRDVEPLVAALASPTCLVGRDPEMAWLSSHLHATTRVAVVGPAGIGKSALAAEYRRCHAGDYSISSKVVLDSRGAGVMKVLPHGRWARSNQTLYIIEYGGGEPRWGDAPPPPSPGHVIVTAKTPPAGFPGAVLELAPLPHDQAVRLFEHRAGTINQPVELQQRNEVVAAAAGIPAALVRAADSYRRGWSIAISPLIDAKAPPGSLERSLLEGALPFADRSVPLEWAALVGKVDPHTEAAAVAHRLEAAGLARLGPDPDTFTVHPLARDLLRNHVAPEAWRAVRARAEEIATRWMMNALAREIVPHVRVLAQVEALASNDDDEAEGPWQGALRERLAAFHRRRGDYDRGDPRLLELAERITSRHRAVHGDLHAIVMAQLASFSSKRRDLDRARRALAEAIGAAQSQLADGSVRWRDVDPDAYREALEAMIDTAKILRDPGSEARAVFSLADFHGRRGGWERAAALAEHALRAARRANEPDLIARAYRLRADAALHGSRYEDARLSYEEAIRRLDQLGAEQMAATTRLLYVNLLLQLNRREAAVRHVDRLRGYLAHAPASWPYHAEAARTLRLFDGSATEGEG